MRCYRAVFLILLLFCLSVLCGCQSETPVTDEKSSVIGVSINSQRSPFMIALTQGIVKEAEARNITVNLAECNGDIQTQADQITNFIVQGVDAILMQPLDAYALIAVTDKAEAAGIPVFCIDTTVNTDSVLYYIGSDSYEMGVQAAEYIARQLYQKYGSYRGTVVDLMASLTSTSGTNRSRGFSERLAVYPDITIAARQNGGLQLDTAIDVMTDILHANSQIDAIWCSGDTNAQGVIRALMRSGRLKAAQEDGHIIVVSADGAAESLQAIRDGYVDACISQNPIREGSKAIDVIDGYLKNGMQPEMKFEAYPLFVITADNLDSPSLAAYGIWSQEIR